MKATLRRRAHRGHQGAFAQETSGRPTAVGWDAAARLLPFDNADDVADVRACGVAGEAGPCSPGGGREVLGPLVQGRFDRAVLHEWLAYPAGQLVDGDLCLWVTDEGRVAVSMPGVERRLVGEAELDRLRAATGARRTIRTARFEQPGGQGLGEPCYEPNINAERGMSDVSRKGEKR